MGVVVEDGGWGFKRAGSFEILDATKYYEHVTQLPFQSFKWGKRSGY